MSQKNSTKNGIKFSLTAKKIMNKILVIILFTIIINHTNYAQNSISSSYKNTSRLEIIAYETGIGILVGTVAIIPSALIIRAIHGPADFGEALGLATASIYLGFTLGSTYGIHNVDKKYNRNSSYLISLGGGIVGLGISYYILKNTEKIKGIEAILSVIAPMVSSIVAVNLFNFELNKNDTQLSYNPELRYGKFNHNIYLSISI